MLYRWPQGRVLRTILLVLVLLIAGDLAVTGAWSYFEAWGRLGETTPLVYGIVLATLSATVLIGGVLCIGFIPKTASFLIEVEHEMVRVTWPGRSEVVRATIVIAIMTAVLALILFAVDGIFYKVIYEGLLEAAGGAA